MEARFPRPIRLIAALVLVTGACVSTPTSTTTTSKPQLLNVVLTSEPLSLDPSIENKKSSIVSALTYMEALAVNNPDQTYKPLLAESWQQTEPTKWRIKLRQGVKFHNGEPFNADAVAFSVKNFLTTKGQTAGQFAFISGTQKIDEYTIDLITTVPTSILPSSLSTLFIFPPKYYAEVGPEGFGKKPVGTGPWRFVEWVPGVHLKVEAFPDYWGKKPAIREIQFQWAGEASTRAALLQTGEVQLAQSIPPSFIDQVNGSNTAQIATVQSLRNMLLYLNHSEGPTSDVRVRKALNYAIDKDSIIKNLFQGRAYPDKGINFTGFEGYQGDKLQPWPYDPTMAKKLLADAGYPNGFEITFYTVVGGYILDKESAEAITAQLGKVGIKANLQVMESGIYYTKLRKAPGATDLPRSASGHLLGMALYSCAPLWFNPVGCATFTLNSSRLPEYGANAQTDAFYNSYLAELDATKRVQIIHDFENYVYNEYVPFVWLWRLQDIYGVSKKLNWTPRPDELMSFDEASFK